MTPYRANAYQAPRPLPRASWGRRVWAEIRRRTLSRWLERRAVRLYWARCVREFGVPPDGLAFFQAQMRRYRGAALLTRLQLHKTAYELVYATDMAWSARARAWFTRGGGPG